MSRKYVKHGPGEVADLLLKWRHGTISLADIIPFSLCDAVLYAAALELMERANFALYVYQATNNMRTIRVLSEGTEVYCDQMKEPLVAMVDVLIWAPNLENVAMLTDLARFRARIANKRPNVEVQEPSRWDF